MLSPLTCTGFLLQRHGAKLKQVLEHCPKTVTEVEVIHGYHSGQALQKLVRKDFKHARIASRSFGLQNGITNYILK